MTSKQVNVEIAIKARDETRRALQSAKSALNGFAAAQARTAARRGQFTALQDEAREVMTALNGASASAAELGRKLSTAKRPTQAMKADFAAARAEAARLKGELLGIAVAAGRMNGKVSTPGSFAAFDAVARGATRAEAGLETLTNATVRNTAAAGANAAAMRRQATAMGVARAPARGFLGLRSHELSNLSFQVNDVVSGLAMGQRPMQIFAQQGGQIAQIFPRAAVGLLRFLPVIGLITAALSPFIASMAKANAEAATLKEFDLLLTRSGNAAAYTAPRLAAVAAALDKYDGSLANARAALTEFVGDAVAPEYLERFGKAALDLSKVMEMDVAEAAKKVSDAFTGNADAILALDDELGFLTETERKHAEGLRTQRRDAELRTQAFAAFERQYGETAAKMRGPWSQILADFGAAWDAFVDAVNFIDFGKAARQIESLIGRIQRLTAMLPGANQATLEASRATFLRNAGEIERLEDAGAGGPARATDDLIIGRNGQRARLALLRREQANLGRRIAIQNAEANGGLLGPPPVPADTTTRPPAPAYTAPRGGASDAERQAKQREAFLESLRQESVARQFQLSLIDMTERETRVLMALEQARVRAAEIGLELSAAQVKTIQDEVRAQYDAEQAARGRQLIEQATLELAQARGEVESESAFVTRKLREAGLQSLGETDAANGDIIVTLTREAVAYADILRNIHRINEATRQRAEAEKQVGDLTSLRSGLIERSTFLRDTGRGAEADSILTQIEGVNAQIVVAADNAIAMWRAIGGPAAEAAIAILQTTRDEARGLAADLIVSGQQINEQIAAGGVSAFNEFWDAVGRGENAFKSARDAFLSFAADFLKQIAGMIIQTTILNALQGGGGKGGGVGGFLSGLIGGLFGVKAPVKHDGGMVGEGGSRRMISSAVFANARRYHTGGMPGLKPNEVPTILENTEGVFTKGQMAALAPAGSRGDVKVVNVFDPAELLDRALGTSGGERVLLNFVSRNSAAFKAAIQ